MNILISIVGILALVFISCGDNGKTTKETPDMSSAVTESVVIMTPTNTLLPEKKVSRVIEKDINKSSVTPTTKSSVLRTKTRSILVPTAVVVTTPAPAITESPGVGKGESEVEAPKSEDKEKEISQILSKVEVNMSEIESFSFSTSGTIKFATGGANVELPIISGGTVYKDISRSFFEIYLLVFPIKSETYQSGSKFYSKGGLAGQWTESGKSGPGHISPGFWDEIGTSLFDLKYVYFPEDTLFYAEETIFLVSYGDMKNEAMKLIELSLGSAKDILDDQEMDASVVLGISENDQYLEILKATVEIEEGGKGLSQILNLPQLSGVGPVIIDLQIEFNQFGSADPLPTDPNS